MSLPTVDVFFTWKVIYTEDI